MKRIFTALMLVSVVAMAAFANNEAYKLKVADFHEIKASSGIAVKYTQGALTPVGVSVKPELKSRLEVKVVKGCLMLSLRNEMGSTISSGDVVITVQSPRLEDVTLLSGASFSTEKLSAGSFDVEAATGARVEIGTVTTSKFDIEISAGAEVSVKTVTANEVDIDASTGGTASLSSVSAPRVEIDAKSGADVSIIGKGNVGEFEAGGGASIQAKNLVLKQASGRALSGATINYNAAQSTVKADASATAVNHSKK